MTYEEAKNWLAKQPHHFCTLEEAELDQECRKVINEALEKQIPRKSEVTQNAYGYTFHKCPSCAHEIETPFKRSFCDRCGQAIDWSN